MKGKHIVLSIVALGLLLGTALINPVQAGPTDSDGDKLSDAEEAWVAKTFAPDYYYDNQEHNEMSGGTGIKEGVDVEYFFQVTQGDCVEIPRYGHIEYSVEGSRTWLEYTAIKAKPTPDKYVILTVVAAYRYDYVPWDPPGMSEKDVGAHAGDAEMVRIFFTRSTKIPSSTELEKKHGAVFTEGSDKRAYIPVKFVIKRHRDEEMLYDPQALTWHDKTHPMLVISEGKHAAYISRSECEQYVGGVESLGWDEDCTKSPASDRIIRPRSLTNLSNTNNVGEAENPLFSRRKLFGSGRWEYMWSPEIRFCGGYNIYSPADTRPVVEILGIDAYTEAYCGGAIGGKWVGMAKTYTVKVTTKDISGAGTDAEVYLFLSGSKGHAGYIALDTSSNDFERGHTDTFTIHIPDLGEIKQVCLWHDDTHDNSAWNVESVRVTPGGYFDFGGAWLSTTKSPKRLWACRPKDTWPTAICPVPTK